MANKVEMYVAALHEPEQSRISEICVAARLLVPGAIEGTSYGMPALLYRGKGLIAVMSMTRHIGIYPFGTIAELSEDVAGHGLEMTTGSIHLGGGQRIPTELLERLLLRRVAQIDRDQLRAG